MKKKAMLLMMVTLSGQLIIKSKTTVGEHVEVRPGWAEVGQIKFTNKTNKPITLTAYNIDKKKNTGSTTIAANSSTFEAYSYDDYTIGCQQQDGKQVTCNNVIKADESAGPFEGPSSQNLGMY